MHLQAGSPPALLAGDSGTPCHQAAFSGHVEVIKILLAAGAPVDALTTPGHSTPLLWAARQGHVEAVLELLAAGASREVRNAEGKTALQLAIAGGHSAVAEVLGGSSAAAQAAAICSRNDDSAAATAAGAPLVGLCRPAI